MAVNYPDCKIRRQSYNGEKIVLRVGTFERLTVQKYQSLVERGTPKAISSMCVLTVKRDEKLRPLRAKFRIVVLGNLEDRCWPKLQSFSQVLWLYLLQFLISLAVESGTRLNKVTVRTCFVRVCFLQRRLVCPPPGDPDAG